MTIRSVINAGLLAVPVGVTIGAIMGIEAYRQATGQSPLFSDGWGDSTISHGVVNTRYCDLFNHITPKSKGQLYTLNPNQWGVTDDTSGSLCMNVTSMANGSYPTLTTAPEFSVTWQFDPQPKTQPVHAFPNIMVDDILPTALDTIDQLNLNLHWTYGVGDVPANTTNISELKANSVNTNVALDMFLDSNSKTATDVSKANYEIMIWFAGIGPAAQPFGFADGIVTSQVVNNVTFNLYTGQNSLGQNVLTWLASDIVETFRGNIFPLISGLFALQGDTFPSLDDYLGVFSLGTEAFSSSDNVTFWLPELSVEFREG